MPNIAFFIKQLNPHIIKKQIAYHELDHSLGISLFDVSTTICDPEYLYIGTAEHGSALLNTRKDNVPVTIFFSGHIPEFYSNADNQGCNLISTDLSVIDLYNRVNQILRSYQEWNRKLVEALSTDNDLAHILDVAGNLLKGQILLFNSGMHLMNYSHTSFLIDPYVTEAIDAGYWGYNTMKYLMNTRDRSPQYSHQVRLLCPETSDCQIYSYPIHYQGNHLATLFFFVEESRFQLDLADMIYRMGGLIRPLLIQNQNTFSVSGNPLASLLNDFDSEKMLSPVEIRDRIRLLPYACRTYIRCIHVQFRIPKEEESYRLLLNRISLLLPNTNMTIWKSSIIILYSAEKQEFTDLSDFSLDDFDQLLEEYEASAIISNSASSYASFRSIYYLTLRLSNVLSRLKITSRYKNIAFYNEYIMYLIIDMMSEQFQKTLSNNDIILLTTPEIVTLTRYDRKHNTNLREILYHYIRSGRSVTKTGEILYMHRNTVLNKLKKIQELCPLDLEDGITTEMLLFSCQLLKFYEEYLNLELKL